MFLKTFKKFKKVSLWTKMLFILCFILFILIIYNKYKPVYEGFHQRDKFIVKYNNDIYDPFYASIYNNLFSNQIKDKYEISEIVNTTKLNKKSVLLDIGSGLGNHVSRFSKHVKSCVGLDKSLSMVNAAKSKYKDYTLAFK